MEKIMILLLIVIYIAFIGLGIPDSLFGVAWPSMYQQFNLRVSTANYIIILTCLGTIVSSLNSSRLIHRYGTAKITIASTLLTSISLLGISVSPNIWWIFILSFPLGLGAGAIDTALNNYVALHYSASQMSFLHCFYGFGVLAGPYFMSVLLKNNFTWQNGYQIAFLIQVIITVILFSSLQLWPYNTEQKLDEKKENKKALRIIEVLKIPGVKLTCLIFIATCTIETTCGVWGSTFLVNSRFMTAANAAQGITFYYLGMFIGRLCSGIMNSRLNSWTVIFIGHIFLLIGIFLVFIPVQNLVVLIGLLFIGFGNSIMYPNFVFLTPINFGQKNSQSIMGIQMTASYFGTLFMTPIFGVIAQHYSTGLFPYYLLIACLIMALATMKLKNQVNKHKHTL
ncbi:MFS transporter [Leuconostoc suionicum]|uniref:MFS transporter n=1 Tax=Leuconostoc suionicum TaxID=1511761 RepID=UPI00233F17E9|nr:MFS transporter [Leuconostoc suionicum]MDC2805110.1 MFS transporter [Leuconostoc suionicum]MDC2822622.1 MFS transporter [Leuconostoc suionicum]